MIKQPVGIEITWTWSLDPPNFPDIAPEDNPTIWCERCKRHHKKYTMTKHDFEQIMRGAADKLDDAICEQAFEAAMKEIK